MTEPERKTLDLAKIPLEGAETALYVYTNNAEVLIAPWDIRLAFTEVVSNGTGSDIRKVLRANVTMSPGHAKALAGALALGLKQYEEVFGAIKMPTKTEASETPE